MGKKKEPPKAEVPEWVVTFGDLMSLLLCFFILLAAFSELKQPREYQKVLDAIKEAMGADGGFGLSQVLRDDANTMVNFLEEQAKRDQTKQNTNDNTDPNVPGQETRVSIVQEGARQAVGGSILFEPASYTLSATDMDTIRAQIAPRIAGLTYICPIVGHAWGVEDQALGMSHGELAFRRAEAVKEFLVRECGVNPGILRVESASTSEPMTIGMGIGQDDSLNRRVQVYQSGRTLAQVHPDPNFTGVE